MFNAIFGVFCNFFIVGLKAFLKFSYICLTLHDSKQWLESRNRTYKKHTECYRYLGQTLGNLQK